MSAACLATSVPAIPMAMPIWAALQRRRIVNAVAGNGHDMLLLLQRLHDAHLLIGGNPGEDDFRVVQRELKSDGRKSA